MDEKPGPTQQLWRKTPNNIAVREPNSRPNPAAPLNNSENSSKTSVLRAEAAEFVPGWLKSTSTNLEQRFQNVNLRDEPHDGGSAPRHSAQNRLNKFKNTNQEFQPRNTGYTAPPNGFYECDESTDMSRLRQIINSLIMYPGQFDDLLMVFLESIYSHLDDILIMSEIAKLLVGQAITSPNFRYNGVRLCWYVEQQCPNFRAELHMRCQKELQENPNQQNVVLFIAELYTQLPHDSLYGQLLIDSLKKLLHIGDADNIKCVCQSLKLTGYSLEQNHKEALNDLFTKLKEFTNSLSGSALILLNSVVNLRESHWGRSAGESSNSDSSEYDHDYEEMVNGLLYETDGQALTTEEQEFLVANATHDYLLDNEDPDSLFDPEPEMDEEIQAAFGEFVRLSKG